MPFSRTSVGSGRKHRDCIRKRRACSMNCVVSYVTHMGAGPMFFLRCCCCSKPVYCTTPLGHYYTVTPSFFFFFSLTKLNFCVFFIFLYQLFFLFCFHFTNVLVFLASPFFFSPRFLHLFDFFLFFPLTFSPAKWITN